MGQQFKNVIASTSGSAAEMTHCLCEFGGGSMGNGIRKMLVTAGIGTLGVSAGVVLICHSIGYVVDTIKANCGNVKAKNKNDESDMISETYDIYGNN